jgi:hypothetical protein
MDVRRRKQLDEFSCQGSYGPGWMWQVKFGLSIPEPFLSTRERNTHMYVYTVFKHIQGKYSSYK